MNYSGTEFEDDRQKLSGLHFAQDSMRKHEQVTLHLAEAMQARCVRVLDLHTPRTVMVPQQRFSDSSMPGVDYVDDYSVPPVEEQWCRLCGGPWPCETAAAILNR